MSERIVDEEFVKALEEDRKRRRSLEEHFNSLRESLEQAVGDEQSPLGEALHGLLNSQLEVMRELWARADERLSSAEERLLQVYVKSGESLAALRRDILAELGDRLETVGNEAADQALLKVEARDAGRGVAAQEMRRLALDLTSRFDLIAARLDGEIEALRHDLERLAAGSGRRIEGFGAEIETLRGSLDDLSARTRLLSGEIGSQLAAERTGSPAAEGDELSDEEYCAHQERFRGSSESVAGRQRFYREHLREAGPVLDAGCGRGEFVAMLREQGVEAYGVEINERAAACCAERGIPVERADLFEHLEGLADESLGGIFAAQVVEHLEPPQIRTLLRHAHRVLKPGGLLVTETLNPESVFALTRYYWQDIGHKAPLAPALMQFLVELAGFSKVELKLLDEVPEEQTLQTIDLEIGLPPALEAAFARINGNVERLNRLLYGHQDYAVFAWK